MSRRSPAALAAVTAAAAATTLMTAIAPARADGHYFTFGAGPDSVTDELGAFTGDGGHVRLAVGHRFGAFASVTYNRRFGTPKYLDDLEHHRLISYSGKPAQHLTAVNWTESVGREGKDGRQAILRINSVVAIKYAIRAGIGIGMIPDYMSENDTDLVPILPDIEAPRLPILFAFPEELKNSKKVQLLRDFLVSKTKALK